MTDIETPDGMKHVGWHCDHKDRETVHKSEEWSMKRQAWKLRKNPNLIESIATINTYRDELHCPHAKPAFIRI